MNDTSSKNRSAMLVELGLPELCGLEIRKSRTSPTRPNARAIGPMELYGFEACNNRTSPTNLNARRIGPTELCGFSSFGLRARALW